jgi:preprotein translocase subunit SecD
MTNTKTLAISAGLLAGVLLLVAFWLYVGNRVRGSFLSKAPEHGVCFTIEADLFDAQGTNAVPELREAIRKRFDRFGTRIFWEPVTQTRFRVYAPIADTNAAKEAQDLAWRRGLLDFRLVHPENEYLISQGKTEDGYELLQLRTQWPGSQTAKESPLLVKVAEEGAPPIRVKQATVLQSSSGRGFDISIILKPESSSAFAKVTRENIGRRLAIVVDSVVLAAPRIQSEIPGGNAIISGNLDNLRALQLAILMECPLPVPVKLVETKSF